MDVKAHIPNWLTYSRIVAIVPIVYGILDQRQSTLLLSFLLFVYAAVTDFLDGYLARRWNAKSGMGRLLDPVADKLLVSAALIALVATDDAPVWPVMLIVMREIFVSGLREFLIERRVILPVSRLAKYKTATQLITTALLITAAAQFHPFFDMLGTLGLWLSVALTLITGLDYFTSSLHAINQTSEKL